MPRKTKKNHGDDLIEKLRRRLAKAQLALHVAQERRVQTITKGEAEVERARRRAADRESKATIRVEKRAATVAQAEARLASVERARTQPTSPARVSDLAETITSQTPEPSAFGASEQRVEMPDGAQVGSPSRDGPEDHTGHER